MGEMQQKQEVCVHGRRLGSHVNPIYSLRSRQHQKHTCHSYKRRSLINQPGDQHLSSTPCVQGASGTKATSTLPLL